MDKLKRLMQQLWIRLSRRRIKSDREPGKLKEAFEKLNPECNQLQATNEESASNYQELQLTNELLRISEERYRLLIENSQDVIYTVNLDGIFTFVSPAWTALRGHPVSEVIGKPMYLFVHPDDLQMGKERFQELLKTGKKQAGTEYRVQHTDGNWHWYASNTAPIRDENNNIIGLYGISRDITERKRAELEISLKTEQLIKANADKDLFISILAHDLKSPFSTILGFLELLSRNIRKYDIDKIEKQLKRINNSAQNTYKLIEDLLSWIRSQSNKLPYDPKSLIFKEICNDVIEKIKHSAEAKNITINQFTTENVMIIADSNMLKTILRNLISNAIKFTHIGGTVDILAEQAETNTTVAISDNGVGMSPETINQLFDSIQTYTTKGTVNESGTGLGLVLCKEFVEKHGGTIGAKKNPNGHGSVFYFTIPNQK